MVMGMLGTGLGKLDGHIKSLGSKLDDESALALAHLLTKIAMVHGELRKAEHAARREAGEFTPQQMLERARRMSVTERQSHVRELQQIDSKRSGLA